jgi:hypothetical protein
MTDGTTDTPGIAIQEGIKKYLEAVAANRGNSCNLVFSCRILFKERKLKDEAAKYPLAKESQKMISCYLISTR